MGDTQAYDVILAPTDTALWEASDTREFTITVDAGTAWGDLDAAVREYVQDHDLLDAWAFRRHWDTAYCVRQTGPPQQRLKDALRSCTLPAQTDDVHYPLSVQTGTLPTQWEQTTLVLEDDTAETLAEWEQDMKDEHPIMLYMENRCIHEAMIRAAATVEPTVIERFKTDPRAAHHDFVNIATSYGNIVADELKSVEP